MESHTFVAVWEEFGPTIEDMAYLTMLSMYVEKNAMGMTFGENSNGELQYLNYAMTFSKFSGKVTYTYISSMRRGELEQGGGGGFVTHWLVWFVHPSRLEVGVNSFVFPLAILFAKGQRLALDPMYPMSLCTSLTSLLTT